MMLPRASASINVLAVRHPAGHGGSCFPKDTLALVRRTGLWCPQMSMRSSPIMMRKQSMSQCYCCLWRGRKQEHRDFARFKPETDDMGQPSPDIIPHLLAAGEHFMIQKLWMKQSSLTSSVHLLTMQKTVSPMLMQLFWWPNGMNLGPSLSATLAYWEAMLCWSRNIYSSDEMIKSGLNYHSVGRPKQKICITISKASFRDNKTSHLSSDVFARYISPPMRDQNRLFSLFCVSMFLKEMKMPSIINSCTLTLVAIWQVLLGSMTFL